MSGIKKLLNPGLMSIFLTGLAALLLQSVPLTNTLDYEFCAVMGLILFLIGGFLFLSGFNNEQDIFHFIRSKWIVLSLLIIIPFLIGAVNSLFFNICPFRQGVQFYLFITIFSFILGIAAGWMAQLIARKHPKWLFMLLVAGFIFISLLEFYLFPQVFSYNILIGFESGTIYDELIEFNPMLVFFRLCNILLIAAFIKFVKFLNEKYPVPENREWVSRFRNFFRSVSLAFLFLTLYFILNLFCGFSIPLSTIERDLGGRKETEHFILIYPKQITDDKILISALHHEFYYKEISEKLNAVVGKKIVSIQFLNQEQKRKYIGTANADISKPWQNMVITDFYNHDKTLKHEIVHAFSSLFGTTIFRLSGNFNPLILEGFASAVDNQFDIYDLNYAAGMIKDYKNNLKIGELFKGFNFFGQNSSIAYAYSGAFVKFLMDKYGSEKFERAYTNPDFEKIYGKDIAALEKEFEKFLLEQGFTYNKNSENLYFAGKPVFMKKCPRYAAYMMKLGNEYYYSGNYVKALTVYGEVYKNLETSNSLSGIINSKIRLNQERDALALLETEIKKFYKTNSQFVLQIALADLYVRNNLIEKAAGIYKEIINAAPHPSYVINAFIKLRIIEEGNNTINEYVKGDIESKAEIINKSSKLEPIYKVFWYSNSVQNRSDRINELYSKIENTIPSNYLEQYLFFDLYSYLKDKGEFDKAKIILELCFRYNSRLSGFSEKIMENRKKIEYLINFKDKIFRKQQNG